MDIKHHYIEKGEGEPIILLHGNGGDSEYFHFQIDEFSKHYKVFAIDTRGHGKTPRGASPFTMRQFAKDLLFFMDEKEIKKANLLGFSDGGNIALLFSMNYPDRVLKLIVDGANLDPSGVDDEINRSIIEAYEEAKKYAEYDEKENLRAEMMLLMIDDPNIFPTDLISIKAETLVIAGTDDLIKKEHTKLIADNIPNSTLKFIKGGHLVAVENPIEFNNCVLDFLKKQ
jgi:pimeloyl-ACP methyl ester carboxylesterase